jgi:hypothetical protein
MFNYSKLFIKISIALSSILLISNNQHKRNKQTINKNMRCDKLKFQINKVINPILEGCQLLLKFKLYVLINKSYLKFTVTCLVKVGHPM